MPACLSYRPICVALPADSSAKPVIRPSAASWLSCAGRSASAVSASRSCACWSGVVPGWAANCASAASSCGLGLAIPGSFPGSGSVQSTDGLHAKSHGFPGDHVLRNDRDRDVVLVIAPTPERSEEHTSELQSLMSISYAVFCLKKKNNHYLTYLSYNMT